MAKKIFDLLSTFFGVILLLPLILLIALAIKLDDKGPVFFLQDRVGQNGKLFKVIKFRSMVENAEKMGAGYAVEENDQRITRVGRVLRRFSLDELPQLFNILKGEMSVVGPRPTLPYQVERYDERQKRRLLFKPGITGWAQVNGRNTITWPERIELDLWYIDNWSFWLDLKVIIKTFAVILNKQVVYRQGQKDHLSSLDKDDT